MAARTRSWLVLLGAALATGCSSGQAGTEGARPSATGTALGTDVWAEATLESLSLRQRVAQLVIQWLPGSYASPSSDEFREWADWVAEDQIGGIYLSIGLPHSYAAKVNELQALADVPLLVTSDFENGGPGMRINHSYALPSLLPQGGGTSFPPTMAFGAIGDERYTREYGRITGVEARAVGVNLNFAPVLDVNSNPLNPIINTRSFGEDPELVARMGAAYLEGARAAGLLTTAKHFPGHGDTETDSHVDLPVVPADWERLETLELVPFQRAIDEGVDAVMTAHVVASGIQGPDAPPATLDPVFMTDLLRTRMGFGGLLFTDALRMGAIENRYGGNEVAVLALEAGADVLLMPEDVTGAIDVVVGAVEDGRLSHERIDRSARRVLQAKAKAGLHRNRFVDLDAVDDIVGSGPHQRFADSAASRSITLLRDESRTIPVLPTVSQSVLSITYARTDNLVAGTAFDPDFAPRVPSFASARVGPETPRATYDSLLVEAVNRDLVLLNAYVPPRAGAGDVAVPEELGAFVRDVAARVPLIVSSFGNPYLLAALPEAPTYLIAWGDREVSQRAAVRALFGEAAISGRLPISIPPHYAIGDGLDRPALGPTTPFAPTSADGGPEGPDGRSGEARRLAPTVFRSPLEGDAAEVGMDAGALDRLDLLLLSAIADRATPGAVVAVGRHGRLVRLRGYGKLDWDPASNRATAGSLYDLASLTKVVGTTSAAMKLVDDGALDLDDRVVEHLPWWGEGDPRKETVTVRQLLLHRAGLPPFRRFFLEMEGRRAYERAIGALPLDYEPGTRTVYSDIGPMTVAFIIEEVSGRPLDAFLEDRLWEPLGMRDTGFLPSSSRLAATAPTEVESGFRDTHVRGVVHDENAHAIGGVAGHAGLFSTAWDLSAFAQMMLGGGVARACEPAVASGAICPRSRAEDERIFSEAVFETFTRRFDDSASRALGWDTPSGRSSAGDYFTERAFGHTGFTGTSIWIDPELDVFVVLLTNRVNPTRENQKHVPLRRSVHDLVAQAIRDRPVAPRSR